MRALHLLPVLLPLAIACAASGPAAPPPADPLTTATPSELYETGIRYANQGDFVRAEQYLSSAIDRGYSEAEALPQLVKVCLVSSRYRSALSYALPYLDRNPDAWRLRYLVASIHLGIGDGEAARRELETVVQQVPDSAQPRYLLAVVLRDSVGQPDAARVHFERYLELDPEGDHGAEVRASLRKLERSATPIPQPASTPDEPEGQPLPTETPAAPADTGSTKEEQ